MEKKYLVEESYLTSIADIIRNKTGLTNKLTFPDQFFEEIRNIETSPATVLPVLDMNYPEDVVVMEGANISASFNVVITEPGVPAVYSYQWYFNGEAVEGANSSGFSINQEITKGTYNVYCEVTNEAGTVTSRIGSLVVESCLPQFNYNGTYNLIEEGNYNWKIKFLSSGILTFTKIPTMIDAFAVGGGGGGGGGRGSGGGGGKTTTVSNITLNENIPYTVTIGAGGSGGANYSTNGSSGGTSSIVNEGQVFITIGGGGGGRTKDNNGKGGAGGSGGGGTGAKGGSDGSNGSTSGSYSGGTGQGTTTREFGEDTGTLYAGGGGGGKSRLGSSGGSTAIYPASGGEGGGGDGGLYDEPGSYDKSVKAGATNFGGGGGGGHHSGNGGNGGSGIVIIRNHRS